MNHLINSFSPTVDSLEITQGFQTVDVFNKQNDPPQLNLWSIIFRKNNGESSLNKIILNSLEQISELPSNWDEEGAIQPPLNCVQYAKAIVLFMDAVGQEIYAIAPGPLGEIMLDFRNDSKSLELIIYPDKMKYVKFSELEKPEQGIFNPDILFPDLLNWLNNK